MPDASLVRHSFEEFEAIAPEWERLASASDSPFLTAAWCRHWWRSFAAEDGYCMVLRSGDGALRAGGILCDAGPRRLRAASGSHTNDWGLVAVDDEARVEFWRRAARLGGRSAALGPLSGEEQSGAAVRALEEEGYRVVVEPSEPSPWMELPGTLDEVLGARSRNLRSQVGRRTRKLEEEGALELREVTGGAPLERELARFFELEASGWKGTEGTGTAIGGDPRLVALYRGFAQEAAAAGWFRLYLLELDGRLIAADYGVAFEGCGYLIKTAFDEYLGRMAPGLVLRAKVIESSIAEGLERYDFLGGPDGYKMRWTDRVRARVTVRAWCGAGAILPHTWRRSLRPALKRARDGAGERLAGRGAPWSRLGRADR